MKRLLLVVFVIAGCGPATRDQGDDGGGGGDAGPADASCPTSISGKVFAPNGTLPLYNVTVYAPISDPPPFPAGVQCTQCQANLPGGSYASATTDAEGKFTLQGIPAGFNVPVIVTTGKWRRKIIVPVVTECADTPLPDGTFRLPKNRSEGEMPRIAVVTGGCDGLACIFSKIGIDTSEFGSSSAGAQSVVFFNGSGGAAPGTPAAATGLWGSLDELKKYDLVINSCECSENNGTKTSPDLLKQYADMGGRVFGSHFHYTWSKNLIPAWQSTATWTAGTNTAPDLVDMTHAGGMALAQWLVTVGASTVLGQIPLSVKAPNASAVGAGTTRWLHASGTNPTSHYLSFQTPVGAPSAQQCGKVVYAGMHVNDNTDNVTTSFPMGCAATLSPSEKALVFLLFDLTTCVGPIF